jgi:O-6-methylguanine DNA methyltransferase
VSALVRSDRLHTWVPHPLTNLTIYASRVHGTLIIHRISFGLRNYPGKRAGYKEQDKRLKGIAHLLSMLLDGSEADTTSVVLDYSWCTPFQKKVLTAARKIPRGTIVSYSQLARLAGYPQAIRAVASIMRNNRFPLIIPCHRVILSSGAIGGFMGKAHGRAIALKRRLLANERSRTV